MTQGQGENGGEPRGEQDSRDASGPLPSVLFASCSQMDGVQVTPVLGSSTLRSGSVSKGSAAPSPVNSSPLFPQTASSYYPERFHGVRFEWDVETELYLLFRASADPCFIVFCIPCFNTEHKCPPTN